MENIPPIYLASKSPRRYDILSGLGINVKIISSPYEEKMSDVVGLVPEGVAAKLASLKASCAAEKLDEGFVIGSDTIVVRDNDILGKPRDRADAEMILKSLSNRSHRVVSGVSIVDAKTRKIVSCSEVTKVFFRELSEKDIITYLNTDEPYDKAGAYGIQGHAALFVEKIEGCYFNVVGFPVVAFRNLLLQQNYDILDFIQ